MPILAFQKPDKVVMLESSNSFGKFEFRPLEPGYGQTIGNALRRILLSAACGKRSARSTSRQFAGWDINGWPDYCGDRPVYRAAGAGCAVFEAAPEDQEAGRAGGGLPC